ncbi:MAG: phosphoglucosamine mutase [Oscillospiraceae bacterium]|nr:phosphoglucosamine mutase [Oscillospiraceae bacterium]
MARLFGTDGVRGVAGSELTPELAINIGRAAASVLTKHTEGKATVLIGKDTRISGDMLESALCAGLCSVGADVKLCGVVPTPAIAYLVKKYGCDAGVVISASHNPMEFNGIKIFNGEGYKLADEIENEIEALILDTPEKITNVTGGEMGTVTTIDTAVRDYVDHIKGACEADFSGLKVVFDCANGAASNTAPLLFTELGVQATFIGAQPDGTNINAGCGSTHLDKLAAYVKENGFDCGIAFDGDADRCLAVDENGDEIDGDKIIAILATRMKAAGKLAKDTAVVTVMSNLGFMKHMEKRGIATATTAVGDRYVLEEMLAKGYNIGGEQSGHVILSDFATTGDGQLTAVALLNNFAKEDKKVSEFNGCFSKYPQVLINVKTTAEGKAFYKKDEIIEGFIEAKQQQLMGAGRVLVRLSGTEPLIRVMVEGESLEKITAVANEIVDKIKERLATIGA